MIKVIGVLGLIALFWLFGHPEILPQINFFGWLILVVICLMMLGIVTIDSPKDKK